MRLLSLSRFELLQIASRGFFLFSLFLVLITTGVFRSFALAIYGGFVYCATLLLINWAN
jgi:hypothetical protein